MKIPRGLKFALPAAVFAGLAMLFAFGLGKDPRRLPSALIDKPAPEFVLQPLDDGKPGLGSADLKGDVVLVNVFASWCGPCAVEHPLLMRLSRDVGMVVHGINHKDAPDDARAFLAKRGDPYTRIGVDRNGRASIDWGVYGLPESFLVDRDGRIRFKWVGPLTPQVVDETLIPLWRKLRQ
ncbi:MAG: DsbE family thiol:disulfide interchange protein [Alphaproteobacteria bacterium]